MKQAAHDAAAQKNTFCNGVLGVARTVQGKFTAGPIGGVGAGVWETPEEAGLARDRVVLHMGLVRALNFPEQARALGPASVEQMRQAAYEARAARFTSRYRGVRFDAARGRWMAGVMVGTKMCSLGRFDSELEAAHAYDEAMWDLRGKVAVLNFAPPRRRPTGKAPPRRALPKKSRYRGVSQHQQSGKYVVQLLYSGVVHSVGMFASDEDAAEAHDRLCLHFGMPREELNFRTRKLKPASLEQLREEARSAFKETTTSAYRGVHWDSNRECWTAKIAYDCINKHLGNFDNEEEAAHAYDRAALQLHEHPKLNFPDGAPRGAKEHR